MRSFRPDTSDRRRILYALLSTGVSRTHLKTPPGGDFRTEYLLPVVGTLVT